MSHGRVYGTAAHHRQGRGHARAVGRSLYGRGGRPLLGVLFFFFSSRRRHTRCGRDWSSDVCSSDLEELPSAGTACRWTEETRQWLIASSREELRERFPVTFDVMKREGMQSVC